jgi:hypothetical protein
MSEKKYVPGGVLLSLFLFAAGLRLVVFILESMLVPVWAVRALTVVLMLVGLGYLIRHYLRPHRAARTPATVPGPAGGEAIRES